MSKGRNNFGKLGANQNAASSLIEDKKKTHKMTFDMEADLHLEMKKYHKETGITMGFMLNEAVRDLLKKKGIL